MSELRVDDILDKEGLSAPGFSKGAVVTGVCTATTFVGALTGNVTATTLSGTLTGTASGLAGSPDITVGSVSATQVNVSVASTLGVTTATSSVVGSAVTSNDSGIVAAGIITAGTCFKTGDGFFGAGIGATITGAGDAVFAGVTTAATLHATNTVITNLDTSGTLVEGFSSTTTAWSSNGTLNITNGNIQFSSANLAGTNNTLDIISTTGINTDLAVGQSLTVTGITSVNASTAYVNALKIDGISQTGINWTGGSAPSDGGSAGLDLYTFTILKTGSETFIVAATQTKTS
jgi:hypothetical protein